MSRHFTLILMARFLFAALMFSMHGVTHAQAHDMKKSAHKKPALAIGASFSPSGDLWIVGLDAQSHLTVKISRDDGKTWDAARIIDTGADQIAAAGESRPKLAFGPNGWAVIAYTQPLAKPYTGAIRMLRSGDGGKTFSAPYTVHQDRQIITHRFESIAFDAQGKLHTVWVDKRDGEKLKNVKSADGKSAYRGAAIYRNVSKDGGATFSPDIKVADHSCECCQIGLAPTAEGNIVAMWRHVFSPNVRDHAFATLTNTAPLNNPQRATFDEWKIDVCPHHGPRLAAANGLGGSAYHAVWFGEKAGSAQVRYGRLDKNGAPVTESVALPDERAEHADIVSAGKNVVIVWRSYDGTATNVGAWISADDGLSFTRKQLSRTTLDNDYPILLRKGAKIFVVWHSTGKIYVESL